MEHQRERFHKICNDGVDLKAICFRQDIVVNSINSFKSCLSEKMFTDLETNEIMFPSEAEASNPVVSN